MKAKDYRNLTWSKLKGNWGYLILISLIDSLILSLLGYTVIGVIIFAGPLTLGVTRCYLARSRGEKTAVKDMFNGFSNFVTSFILYFVNTIFIFLWSFLLIIPGIVAELSYSMSCYVLSDNPNISASEARKKSIELMKGNRWKLFCLRFSFIGWILLSVLTFGILFIWVVPYMKLSETEFYKHISGQTDAVITIDPEKSESTQETGFTDNVSTENN